MSEPTYIYDTTAGPQVEVSFNVQPGAPPLIIMAVRMTWTQVHHPDHDPAEPALEIFQPGSNEAHTIRAAELLEETWRMARQQASTIIESIRIN